MTYWRIRYWLASTSHFIYSFRLPKIIGCLRYFSKPFVDILNYGALFAPKRKLVSWILFGLSGLAHQIKPRRPAVINSTTSYTHALSRLPCGLHFIRGTIPIPCVVNIPLQSVWWIVFVCQVSFKSWVGPDNNTREGRVCLVQVVHPIRWLPTGSRGW